MNVAFVVLPLLFALGCVLPAVQPTSTSPTGVPFPVCADLAFEEDCQRWKAQGICHILDIRDACERTCGVCGRRFSSYDHAVKSNLLATNFDLDFASHLAINRFGKRHRRVTTTTPTSYV